MPILFVHGVSSRIENGHDKTWDKILNNLKNIVAPRISKDGKGDDVWIEEAYWGDDSVDFGNLRLSLPNPEAIKRLADQKKSWLERKRKEFNNSSDKFMVIHDFLSRAPKKAWNWAGHELTRVTNPFREKLNKETTLFLGDIFFYLSRRGEVNKPGAITKELLSNTNFIYSGYTYEKHTL